MKQPKTQSLEAIARKEIAEIDDALPRLNHEAMELAAQVAARKKMVEKLTERRRLLDSAITKGGRK